MGYEVKKRYYLAEMTDEGHIKIVEKEVGPYYDCSIVISKNGYDSEDSAVRAMENLLSALTYPDYAKFFVLTELIVEKV